jgi:hypothetical protein
MMMNKVITVLLMLVFLSGCATGKVVQTGKDTYMITGCTSTPFSKGDAVLAKLYGIANKYCSSKNKQLYTVKTECSNWAAFARWSTAVLTFKCLSENDPDFVNKIDDTVKTDVDVRTKEESNKSPDLYAELTKLEELRKKGILTEEEFQTQKKLLLEKQK